MSACVLLSSEEMINREEWKCLANSVVIDVTKEEASS